MTAHVKNVSFRFPNQGVLFSDISFTVAAGEAVAIVGPNGSGKTTLLRIIARALNPSPGGTVEYSQECRLVFVPTHMEHFLLPWYSVKKNLAFFNRRQMSTTALDLIRSFFPELAQDGLSREVFKLSMGEKAIVGYACALEANPNLLLLDELFGNLSSAFLPMLMADIRLRLQNGLSIVFTSHDPDVVRELANKTVALQ